MVINKPIFNKPTVYSDYNIWGTKLNVLLDLQDTYNGKLSNLMNEMFSNIATLESDKVSIDDVPTYVTPVMDNYFNVTIKPEINDYVTNISFVSIDNYVDTKKVALDASILEGHELTLELNDKNTTASSNISTLTSRNASATTNISSLETENSEATSNISQLKIENDRGENLYPLLNESVATSEVSKENLDASILEGNTTNSNLDDSIEEGKTTKINLDESISTGNTLKSNLDSNISTGATLKSNLDTNISIGNTLNTNLKSSISTGNTTKSNLDSSISSANTINGTLGNTITTATISQNNLQDKIDEVPSLIQNIANEGSSQIGLIKDEGDNQVARLQSGGYIEITDISTDLPLQKGYYEIVDAQNNQYSVYVGSDLHIQDGQVIKDASGLVRVQGVELPCFMAIRNYPTLSGNTNGIVFLEVESNFENAGSPNAIKHLEK